MARLPGRFGSQGAPTFAPAPGQAGAVSTAPGRLTHSLAGFRDHRGTDLSGFGGSPPRVRQAVAAGTASRPVCGDTLAELDLVAGAASVRRPDPRGFGPGIEARVVRRVAAHPAWPRP